jgi:hypothetical protein
MGLFSDFAGKRRLMQKEQRTKRTCIILMGLFSDFAGKRRLMRGERRGGLAGGAESGLICAGMAVKQKV